MKRLLFIFVVLGVLNSAHAVSLGAYGTGFQAPTINDPDSNVTSPFTGDIVFDSSLSVFKGFNGTIWQQLGAAPVTAPTIQKFTSGSGTYQTPTGVRYIRVIMVGGGGGGGGSGRIFTGSASGNGGNTTFGNSLLVANGGGGISIGNTVGSGGTASLGTGPIGIALTGASGGTPSYVLSNYVSCGYGGASPLGGAGSPGYLSNGGNAVANTGSGGGGGGGETDASIYYSGAGGGAGGYVNAIINSPDEDYDYSVGAGGTAGGNGTGGTTHTGGAGGSGIIIVEEYYQ